VSTPKRKRFNRSQQLEAARPWLQEYSGKKIVRDYQRYFGVDWQTAFKELEILGCPFQPITKQQYSKPSPTSRQPESRKRLKD
jgi:hypothetical protein